MPDEPIAARSRTCERRATAGSHAHAVTALD